MSRVRPWWVVLLCGASVPAAALDAGAVLDGGMARSRLSTFKWEVPNVVSTVEIPGITWALGVPVKMHAVTVKGKMDDTMRSLYDSFVRQGLFVEARLQVGPLLTGVDPDTLMTYTAVFQENAPGFITVVLGEANVLSARPPPGNERVPLFPGAKGLLRTSFEGIDTLAYVIPGTAEEKVSAFYADIMAKAGYRADPREKLVFQKARERVSIQLTRKERDVSVFVTRKGAIEN